MASGCHPLTIHALTLTKTYTEQGEDFNSCPAFCFEESRICSCETGVSRNQTRITETQMQAENIKKCIAEKEKWAVMKVEFASKIRYTVCVITAENRDASDL